MQHSLAPLAFIIIFFAAEIFAGAAPAHGALTTPNKQKKNNNNNKNKNGCLMLDDLLEMAAEDPDHNLLQEGEFQSKYEPKEILGR